jgi:hypothetical protein
VWKNPDAKPKLCFVGCPHLSLQQLQDWTVNIETALKNNGLKKVVIPTVFTAAPKVLEQFNNSEFSARLQKTGVITSYICPLMYMNNPLCKKMPVITSSNKLRTYTSAKYYSSEDALNVVLDTGIPMDEFIVYNSQEFVADKNSEGKSISGSRKKKIYDYINSMNIGYEQKLILAKMEYPADDRYNYEIIEYLNNDDTISYKVMEEILLELGFKVSDDGIITW